MTLKRTVCISLFRIFEVQLNIRLLKTARFLELMHDTIQKALVEEADEAITAEAVKRGSGWLHIQGS
jgi:hypothetical protein